MRTYFDCIPCFVRQALDSVRALTPDETVHERVLREAVRVAAGMDFRQPPPAMGQQIHRTIRSLVGHSDPYREHKDRFNRLALDLYPQCCAWVDRSDHPLETALRLALGGNVIDLGARSELEDSEIRQSIVEALSVPLDGEVREFARAVASATRLLYLADNAGEIVFDRLLIEQIGPEKVTVAVRGAPVINDATLSDAAAAGLTGMVEVIDNGSDAPGTILDDCSPEFRRRFEQADLVLAKGQGNYETLSEVSKDMVFMLRAKCPVIARDLDCPPGALVLRRVWAAKPSESVGAAGDGLSPDRTQVQA